MNSSQCRNVHKARRESAVGLPEFNEWLQKEYGCTLGKVPDDKFDELMDGVKELGGVVEQQDGEADVPAPPPPPPTPPPAPEPELEPRPGPKSKPGREPAVCFSFTDPWHVRRLEPLMKHLKRTLGMLIYYRLHFKIDGDRLTVQEKENINRIKKDYSNFQASSEKDRTIALIVVDDPTRIEHDQIKAKYRIGVQPSLIRLHGNIGHAAQKLDKYCCWGKEDKGKLKASGLPGEKILVTGSVWLSELNLLQRRNDVQKGPIAALYAPANNAPCKSFWRSSGLLDAISKMRYDIIVIRNGRKDPNWLPADCKVYDDFDVELDYIPSLVAAPRGIPLPEPAALKIPVLRLKIGQVVDSRHLMNAGAEALPLELINPNAKDVIGTMIRGMIGD